MNKIILQTNGEVDIKISEIKIYAMIKTLREIEYRM